MKENKYQMSDIVLNYVEGPKNGRPILLLHGNMSRWQVFLPIIPELMTDMHVFALDLRGHGNSSHAAGTYTLNNHLSDVISFIKNKIGSPVVLFGNSLGGMIGLMAASQHPELIESVIVADSPLTLETLEPILESQKDLGHRIIHYKKTNQIEKLHQDINDDFFAECLRACDTDVLVTTFDDHKKMMAGYNIEKIFSTIKPPVLIMRGEAELGSMISDKDMSKVIALCPQVVERKIPGIGHSLLTKKAAITEIVSDFLKREHELL